MKWYIRVFGGMWWGNWGNGWKFEEEFEITAR